MTYEFFKDNYDINDMEIKSIEVKDKKLYLSLSMNIYLDLIANGYRPVMDFNQEKTFVFLVDYNDYIFPLDSKILFKNDSILIENRELKITLSTVDII